MIEPGALSCILIEWDSFNQLARLLSSSAIHGNCARVTKELCEQILQFEQYSEEKRSKFRSFDILPVFQQKEITCDHKSDVLVVFQAFQAQYQQWTETTTKSLAPLEIDEKTSEHRNRHGLIGLEHSATKRLSYDNNPKYILCSVRDLSDYYTPIARTFEAVGQFSYGLELTGFISVKTLRRLIVEYLISSEW